MNARNFALAATFAAIMGAPAAAQTADQIQAALNAAHAKYKDIKEGKKPLEILFGDNWVDVALQGKVQEHR